jgi:hypothetical protein
MTGEYRMTMDPSEKDALMRAPGAPVTPGATVQVLGSSAVISVPLRVYRRLRSFSRFNGAAMADRRLVISGRILKEDGSVAASFTDTVETPDSNYVKTVPLTLGAYRLELAVQDGNGIATPQSLEFRVR